MKNIPIPQKKLNIHKLIDKTEQLLKRMRCKALFYNNDNTSDRKENQAENISSCFTMKSRKFLTQIESMKGCENDLTKMIEKHAHAECIWHVLLKLDEDI